MTNTPKPGPWVVRLPPWLAALVEAVPHGERGRRLEQHCAERGTKAGACAAAGTWLTAEDEAHTSWHWDASSALDRGEQIPPPPWGNAGTVMPRVPLGRLSPEVKADLARRAAWAGIRTEDYACGVILSAE